MIEYENYQQKFNLPFLLTLISGEDELQSKKWDEGAYDERPEKCVL